MIIRAKFEEDLTKLKNMLKTISHQAEHMLANSLESLKNFDKDLANEVNKGDSEVNLLNEKIHDYGIILITKQQPVAIDLRRIIVGIDNSTDIERIADFATNICNAVIRLKEEPKFIEISEIAIMVRKCEKMLEYALRSYVTEDVELARAVIEMDEEVDLYEHKLLSQLIPLYCTKNYDAGDIMQMAQILRYLERIGDHAVNIAERTEYLVKGKHRH